MLPHEYLSETHDFATPEQWGVVQRSVPQQWVEQALQVTGVATPRKRHLPMAQALWLVLGVALLRDRPILNVADVFALHHERWDIKLPYGEIKTGLLSQAMTLRSQLAEGVKQGLWTTLPMYNLIRLEITRIAGEAKVEPCRISFITALRHIVDEWLWRSSCRTPGSMPGKLKAMRQNIRRHVLTPRRSERRCTREVRMTKTQYPIKKKPLSAD